MALGVRFGWVAVGVLLAITPTAQAQGRDSFSNEAHAWESFYVIIGSSAAALTGLMFVVIALTADKQAGNAAAMAAFATPTVVHFGAVLLVSALIAMPHPAGIPVDWLFVTSGMGGLAYVAFTARRVTGQDAYKPVIVDWIWHILLPILAYVVLTVAGILLSRNVEDALYAIGAAALLLLFVGIHNAWDAAVYIAVEYRTPRATEREPTEPPMP